MTFSPWTIRLGDTSTRTLDPETGLLDALWVGEERPLTDGDFALLLRATPTDGDGARHPVAARVFVDGTRVIFDAEAEAESRACLADLAHELDKRGEEVVVVEVEPWRKRFEPWQGVVLDPQAIRVAPGRIRLRPGPQI